MSKKGSSLPTIASWSPEPTNKLTSDIYPPSFFSPSYGLDYGDGDVMMGGEGDAMGDAMARRKFA